MVSAVQELKTHGEHLSRFKVQTMSATRVVHFMARGVMIGELGDREGGSGIKSGARSRKEQ